MPPSSSADGSELACRSENLRNRLRVLPSSSGRANVPSGRENAFRISHHTPRNAQGELAPSPRHWQRALTRQRCITFSVIVKGDPMDTSQFEISRRSALGLAGAAAVALGTVTEASARPSNPQRKDVSVLINGEPAQLRSYAFPSETDSLVPRLGVENSVHRASPTWLK